MIARALRKVRFQSGETLVETLASMLIATLAVVVLTTSVTTAASMNHSAAKQSEATQEQLLKASQFNGYIAETGETSNGSGTLAFTDKDDATRQVTYTGSAVAVYGGQDIVSYDLQAGGA
ncbi:MAG: hypothetical protein IJ111_01930 [Eggerthellaceae bacterium]|nr:hypothetical protein [Eggerthellaceae bacterium]